MADSPRESGGAPHVADSPFRRVTLVLAVYVVVGWLVMGLAGWLRRVLALPELFDVLLRAGLLVGFPIAAVLAWHYPRLGVGGLESEVDGPSKPWQERKP